MSGAAATIVPRYVRLSGEIADQSILDSLRSAYPDATVAHVFASTEAGVAFEVRDGQAGFPLSLIGARGGVELRIQDETLQIRSSGTAQRYLGEGAEPLRTAEGFVDTGDRLEARAGRYYFMGRRGGVINFFGGSPSGTEVGVDTNLLHYSELTQKASFHHTPALVRKALEVVSRGYVTAKDFVNRVEPLTNLLEVMQHLMSHNGHLKTAIIP